MYYMSSEIVQECYDKTATFAASVAVLRHGVEFGGYRPLDKMERRKRRRKEKAFLGSPSPPSDTLLWEFNFDPLLNWYSSV